MFKKINLLICLMIIFVVFSGFSNKVYANETFYYKGSTYTGSYSDGLNGSNTTASSVVVISASAAFGYPMGKERVVSRYLCIELFNTICINKAAVLI